MTVATSARDLQALTEGRFVLGLGTQVEAHITRRFSMPWSQPAARMREFVQAVRAIWASWEHGTRLRFEGEFYRHTLSVPMFDPGPTGHGLPPVHVAAVGPRMAEVAGEVADGLMCHTFTSPSYLADVTVPALQRGRARAGRPDDVEVSAPVMVATGPAGADLTDEVERARRTVAFYGSTPAYRGVLDHHGWGDLHADAHALTKQDRWDELADLVDDEVLRTFAVVGDPAEAGAALRTRYAGLADRVCPSMPYDADDRLALDLAE
jgi:probable F420-dependent oxidoreductase